MPEPTPGETAYDAYWPALGSAPPVAWHRLMPEVQRAWEAAAQAVRATASCAAAPGTPPAACRRSH